LARKGAAVEIVRVWGTWRVTIVAQDRPFLLASISGALASFGMNILKAEAFTNRRSQALDTFVFDDPHRTLELNAGEVERLHDLLIRAMLGKVDTDKLVEKRRRPTGRRRVEPSVSLSNDLSETSTLIEIQADDRPGLLYDLTNAISSQGANIEVVLIDTEAHRALDVFYVTVAGKKLSSNMMDRLKGRLSNVCRP
jgi:[protein-PII] uridylyltransferase